MLQQCRDAYGLLLAGHVRELPRQTRGEFAEQPPTAALVVLSRSARSVPPTTTHPVSSVLTVSA
ncbi:hypothetical protein ACFYXM_21830 [Streptomyces sp. NPDC002476]|uniref:hypothetical protein n=1 Tax=Streptomyces sp. NPDC002476 TaxID=3364648 RepID=UPI00367DFB88